ncbi:hypothetical protein B0H11DRAFT_1919185 [Mycena galericulata]|nr:hypothetical protein B0H11DRAFT_1919185 [Mycena galericulata]
MGMQMRVLVQCPGSLSLPFLGKTLSPIWTCCPCHVSPSPSLSLPSGVQSDGSRPYITSDSFNFLGMMSLWTLSGRISRLHFDILEPFWRFGAALSSRWNVMRPSQKYTAPWDLSFVEGGAQSSMCAVRKRDGPAPRECERSGGVGAQVACCQSSLRAGHQRSMEMYRAAALLPLVARRFTKCRLCAGMPWCRRHGKYAASHGVGRAARDKFNVPTAPAPGTAPGAGAGYCQLFPGLWASSWGRRGPVMGTRCRGWTAWTLTRHIHATANAKRSSTASACCLSTRCGSVICLPRSVRGTPLEFESVSVPRALNRRGCGAHWHLSCAGHVPPLWVFHGTLLMMSASCRAGGGRDGVWDSEHGCSRVVLTMIL